MGSMQLTMLYKNSVTRVVTRGVGCFLYIKVLSCIKYFTLCKDRSIQCNIYFTDFVCCKICVVKFIYFEKLTSIYMEFLIMMND